jgi:hypothetical protein
VLPADAVHGAHVILGTKDSGADALAAVLVEEWVSHGMDVVAIDTTGPAMDFVLPFLPTGPSRKARKAKESASVSIMATVRPFAWVLGTPVEVTGLPAAKVGLPLLDILNDLVSLHDEQATMFQAELATPPDELARVVIGDLVATAFGKDFEKFEEESSDFVNLIHAALQNAQSTGIACPSWKELKGLLLDATLLSSLNPATHLSEEQVKNFVATLDYYIAHALLFKGPSFATVMNRGASIGSNLNVIYMQDLSAREQQLASSLLVMQHALATIAGLDKHVTPLTRLVETPSKTLAWFPQEIGMGAPCAWLIASILATGGSLLYFTRYLKANAPVQLAASIKTCVDSSGCDLNLFAGAIKGKDGMAGMLATVKPFAVHLDTAALESVKPGQFVHVHGNDANVVFEAKVPGFLMVGISPSEIKLILQQVALVRSSPAGTQQKITPQSPVPNIVQEIVQQPEQAINMQVNPSAKNVEEPGEPVQSWQPETGEIVNESSEPVESQPTSLPSSNLVPSHDAEAPAQVRPSPFSRSFSTFGEPKPAIKILEAEDAPEEGTEGPAHRFQPEIAKPEPNREIGPYPANEPEQAPVRVAPDLLPDELASIIAEETDRAGYQEDQGGDATELDEMLESVEKDGAGLDDARFLDKFVIGDVKVPSRKEGDTPFDFRFVLNALLHRMEAVIRKPDGINFLKELMDEKAMDFEPALSMYYQETTAMLKNGFAIQESDKLVYRGLGQALQTIITDLDLPAVSLPPQHMLDRLERHLRRSLDLPKKEILAKIEDLDMGQYFD